MRIHVPGLLSILSSSILLSLVLAACAAPAPQALDSAGDGDATREAATQADAHPADARPADSRLAKTRPKVGQKVDMPPMSDPYPPARIDERAPVEVVRSCRTDADCAVRNVGNCCGAMPACVNKDSPTDPAGVQARCAKEGMASVCGFTEIEGCRCAAGQCISAVAPIDPSQDPPVPER
jgi:hypothetical protein